MISIPATVCLDTMKIVMRMINSTSPPNYICSGRFQNCSTRQQTQNRSNYDALSDQHNLIIGSIVLLLTLAGLVITYLTLRQGGRPLRAQPTSTNTNGPIDVEVGSLGQLYSSINHIHTLILSLRREDRNWRYHNYRSCWTVSRQY